MEIPGFCRELAQAAEAKLCSLWFARERVTSVVYYTRYGWFVVYAGSGQRDFRVRRAGSGLKRHFNRLSEASRQEHGLFPDIISSTETPQRTKRNC